MLNAYEKHVGGQNTNKNIFEITSPGRKSIAVYYNDILCFETSSVTHRVCLRGKNRVIEFPQQLSNIEESLGSDFFRCHRSVIVNLRNISQVDYKTCVITLSDGTTCPLSTRKKAALQKKLKHL